MRFLPIAGRISVLFFHVALTLKCEGRLAEIFLSNRRANSHSDAAAKDSGVVCSIALQHGVPVETIRKALLRDARGNPSSPLGCALDLLVQS